MISLSFSYTILAIMASIVSILFVQNIQTAISVKFLGLITPSLPLGLVALIFFGGGALITIPMNWLIAKSVDRLPQGFAPDTPVIDVDYEDMD